MAGRIRQEDIEAVRERTDIVQVISQHLQLKKAGRDSLVGICPFHPEKSPSLSVSPAKQVYYCFGCQEAGDVFRFLVKTEGLSFVEVVERLASVAGVQLRYESQSPADERAAGHRQVLHRAIADAGRLFNRMLVEGREAADAREYLLARGISQASVERFAIGYSPRYSDFLLRRLAKSYSAESLVEAGLVAKDAGGALRDRFRGRVMFPIHDLSGNAVGFGGRLLAGPAHAGPGPSTPPGTGAGQSPINAAKYVNSPDSAVYHKSTLLYNLNRAKAEITSSGRAFIVEGYTDVIALDQAGVRTAVATCGTALGDDHLRLLSRFSDKVILAFDSDEAGARAAERAFAFHQQYSVDMAVLVLPKGQDPADFVLENGAGAGELLAGLAEHAVPLVEYMIGRRLVGRNLLDIEERSRAVREGLALVIELEEPVRREQYARVLADKVGEPERSVMLQLDHMLATHPAGQPVATGRNTGSGPPTGAGSGPSGVPQRQGGPAGTAVPGARTPVTGSYRLGAGRLPPSEEVEREILKVLLQTPELAVSAFDVLQADRFAKPTHRKVYELILETTREGRPLAPSSLVAVAQERPSGDQLGRIVASLTVEPTKSGDEPSSDYARRLFFRLEEFHLKRQADAIRKELEVLNPLKDPAAHESKFEQLVVLEGARRDLRARAEAVGTGP